MSQDSIRRKKLILHGAFWLAYASFFFYQVSSGRRIEESGWTTILLDVSFHLVAMVGISYLNYSFFMPRVLKQKNIGRYLIEFIPVFLVWMYLVLLGKQFILDGFTHEREFVYSFRFGLYVFISAFFLVQFVGLLKFVENYFELEAHKQELEKQHLISELRFLKAQVNPHFLFNTLNNLYYLAFTKSPNTPDVIAKLSQMMRYMLYDSNQDRVPLKKELEYMENYISLEKLRLTDDVPISYTVTGEAEGMRIAPLVFITFLENAFKHGISSGKKGSWIDVKIDVSDKICTYMVANSKVQTTDKTVPEKSGIGLQNVKRRLDLSYNDNYELEVDDNEKAYTIKLRLNLI